MLQDGYSHLYLQAAYGQQGSAFVLVVKSSEASARQSAAVRSDCPPGGSGVKSGAAEVSVTGALGN